MFEYFYGNEPQQYAYYTIPKMLFTEDIFKNISNGSKLLYAFLLDRAGLSIKNNWLDADGKVYVFFKLDELCERLNIGKSKAVKLFNELDGDKGGIGLIHRKKQGQGKPTKIYVMNFTKFIENSDFNDEQGQTSENQKSEKNKKKAEVKTSENQKSRMLKNRSLDLGKSEVTLYSKPNRVNMSNQSLSINQQDKKTDVRTDLMNDKIDMIDFKTEKEKVYKQIGFENDNDFTDYSRLEIEELVNLIVFVNLTTNNAIKINSINLDKKLVVEQFAKLRKEHICYILDCLKDTDSQIKNRRNYLLTCLYNAPSSIAGANQKSKKKENSYDLDEFSKFALDFSLYGSEQEQ